MKRLGEVNYQGRLKNHVHSAVTFTFQNNSKVDLVIFHLARNFYCVIFFGQVLNRKNPSFIRASLLSKECFISPRFCLLEFTITSNLEKYFCGFIHAKIITLIF
jgi:hypothetical protein